MRGKLYIGTSGWAYDHWQGLFYPPEMRKDDWLAFYMQNFDTVEINNTFYNLPTPRAFMAWSKAAPPAFIYSLKGSRFITHMKKLNVSEDSLYLFIDRALLLGDNLGAVLFQLPPRWHCNADRLRRFVKLLPPGIRFTFEFRDPSWFNEDVYDILRESNIALCSYDMPGFLSPVELTADFAYMRFHGTTHLYGGRYSQEELSHWAELIDLYLVGGLDVYAYFNNDAAANAVANARELREMMKHGRDRGRGKREHR